MTSKLRPDFCRKTASAFFSLCTLALLVAISSGAEENPGAVPFQHFITRDGDRLMDGEKEFRFIGANFPGLNLPYDYFFGIPERMILPTPWEQEDAFKTMRQMGLTGIRTWNLSIALPGEKGAENFKCVLGPGEFNEVAFVAIDHMLALANQYGVRIIFSLGADHGDFLGGVGEYAAHRGKPRAAFFSDPQIKDDYKATVRHVLTRKNTVTGVLYSDDKSILAWQFGNEMDRTKPGEDIQRAWQAEMAAFITELAPNQLIAYGQRFFPETPDPNIDIIVRHYYGGDWTKNIVEDMAKTRGKRPFIVGEFGLEADPARIAAMLDGAIEHGASGALIWSMFFHHRDGGFWHHGVITQDGAKAYHWPGFDTGAKMNEREVMQILRDRAFKIRGLTTPPVAPPEAPELLAFSKRALFSWRGSAGAAKYDIQRSPSAEGPWKTIAAGVADSSPCYRPLFADTAARPRDRWCYRVIAKNAGGDSPPSNIVGPVNIEQAVLADEMRTLDLASGHSEGLELMDTTPFYFAEHYYRVKGKQGDWLTYDAPRGLAIETFDISVWNASGIPGVHVLLSADGENWLNATPKPEIVEYQPYYPHGKWAKIRATEHRLHLDGIPKGAHYLKILWPSESLLDRVELRFQ